ncbi:conserved hypothetical protein [Cupriavidus taiwanensis]|uniref:DUF2957 domain-containing protein n=1 Tax=Cupriavidus taiwanensis TaxID=164546 RepID=UPI000E152E13|nr:DUF2957 domain-containing protein [Cupriavidus taiwanensis]SOZ13442.1 conserved hypothetical protein [Cupriavidus taiwanensis]SOZ20471.1 conserved hypothetical protein [Cupriavidus taiwanensis]SOZ41200.1 conserved hypothetical protein [Cupriavidus taiwanensis]
MQPQRNNPPQAPRPSTVPARALAVAATAMLAACGGGGGGDDAPATPTAAQTRLCPAALDYNTTFTGGTGSGELVKVQIDTTRMTWQVTFLDSSVPRQTGTVQPTRSDPTNGLNVMRGTLKAETGLPTKKLNQCAFELSGASLDPSRPAKLFVGEGVAGGTIPGARIQFNGVLGAGAVPDTTFPYFQFIGFAQTETDLAKIAGQYHGTGFHEVPSKQFQLVAQDYRMALAADGSFTVCDNATSTCERKGSNFVPQPSGALLSTHYKAESQPPTLGSTLGKAYLIVGKLRGQLVPIMIRVGYANDSLANGPLGADDEIGIGMMAPAVAVTEGTVNGEYVGVDSNFNYRVTALVGAAATMMDPFRPSDASLAIPYRLDFAQQVPGVVRTSRREAPAGSAPTGKLMFTGGVFGFLEQRDSGPYFTVGAFVQ